MPHGGGRDIFTLVNIGDVVESQLGYIARAVIVDNLTGNYVRVRGAGRDVPPWVWGAVIPVSGSQVADAIMIGSTPVAAGPPVVGGTQATLTFTDEMLSPFSGHFVQQSTFASPQPIAGSPFSVPNDGLTHDLGNVPISLDAQAIIIGNTVPIHINGINMIGNTTGIDYAPAGAGGQKFEYVRVLPSLDSSIDLKVTTANVGGPGTLMYFSVITGPQLVDIDSFNPFPAFLQSSAGQNIETDADLSGTPNPRLGVSLFNARPAPWQVPNLGLQLVTGGIAAGASLTIRAGGGATIKTRLFRVMFSVEAAAGSFGTIECPTGTGRGNWNGAVSRVYEYEWAGLDCGLNADLIVNNTSGNPSGALNGHATISQSNP